MTDSLWEGDVFAGKYKVERVIGQGAMGMVIAARHLGLDEPVAIKVLLPAMLEMPGMVDRFIREARAAARIRGEHVVRVSDVDTLPNGVPFMVMERLEGMDLAELVRTRQRLPITEATRHVRQVLAALDDAHALGVVHRDIKPGNLFLARRRDGSSVVKVLDFGISKLSHGDHVATRAGTVLGSPAYMSPEQMASAKDVDGRTDIWAIGVVLYEMLTGELPFQAEALPQLCTAILHKHPDPPRSRRPEIPAELEAIVLRCLEKDRERRFPTARALADALGPFETAAAPAGVSTAVLPSSASTPPPGAVNAISAPGTQSAPGLDGSRPSGAPASPSTPPSMAGSTQPNMSRSAAIVPAKRSVALPIVGACLALAAGLAVFMATRAPATGGVQAAATHVAAPVTATAAPGDTALAPAASAAPIAVTPATVEPAATAAPSASADAGPSAKTFDPAHAPKHGSSKTPPKAPTPSAPPKPADAPSAADPFQGARK